MKKRIWVTLLALVMITFLMVSCVRKGPAVPAAPDPATFEATPGIGVVELNWGAVAGATFYNIVIDFVAPSGERTSETTHWEYQVANPPFTWTVPYAGTFSWTVQAGNDAGTSGAVAGTNFTGAPPAEEPTYEDPTVAITNPADGATVDSLTPTIEWTATPGATETASGARAYAIDSCVLTIVDNETQAEKVEAFIPDPDAGNNWSYVPLAGVLEYGKMYTVEVSATQEGSDADGEDTTAFDTPAELELELSTNESYGCGTITATVTANNPDIDKVALFGKLTTDQDYGKLAPEGNDWRELDDDHQAVFTLEASELTLGTWVINAQALGSAAKSQEEELEVKRITLIPELTLEVCDQPVTNGQYICVDPDEGLPVQAVFTVTVGEDPEPEWWDYIAEWSYTFEFQDSQIMTVSFTGDPMQYHQQTEIYEISMITECTKYAEVTLNGTTTCGSTFTAEPVTLTFTLDAAQPDVTIDHDGDLRGYATDTVVLTFGATDTKSLCEATLSVFVMKVDEDDEQMPGWEQVEIPWGVESFTVGTGTNLMAGEVEYSGELGISAIPGIAVINATATLESMGELDYAAIFATFTAIDCCAFGCCDECGDPVERESVSADLSDVEIEYVEYDNTFYTIQMGNLGFIDNSYEDYEELLDDEWLLTARNPFGVATICFADAVLMYPMGIIPPVSPTITITGATEAVLGVSQYCFGFPAFILDECTGYPWKDATCCVFEMEATPNVEATVYIELHATDTFTNEASLTQQVIIDTMPPTLTIVNGLKRYLGPGNDALQFSFRNEDTDQGVICHGATVTILPGGSVDSGERGHTSEETEYPPEYYDNDDIVRVNNNESKTWIIDPLYNNGALDAAGKIRLEVLAQDKSGNLQISTMEGDVIDYVPER